MPDTITCGKKGRMLKLNLQNPKLDEADFDQAPVNAELDPDQEKLKAAVAVIMEKKRKQKLAQEEAEEAARI